MGVMERMRKNTGVILWVLIISFGLLWVLADTQFFDAIQRGPSSLGEVNGESISLEEYNNRISYYMEQYSQQTGQSADAEQRANFEQQAWDELVTSKLLEQKMDELGIAVTDQEIVEMVTGENPDQFIRQQFAREDGTIDRVALQSAIESPENRQLWIAIEQQLRQKRRQQKMSNYLQAAMEVSSYEVEQEYIRRNTTADVSYVRFPYSEVAADEISITESDLRSYYNNNRSKYQRNRSYRFEYVSFDKTPTSEDTARTLNEVTELRSQFAEAENDSLFLTRYQSTTSFDQRTVEKDQIRELYRPVVDIEPGEVTEVIRDNSGRLYLLKNIDETQNEITFVVFSLDIRADPITTIDQRAEEADDFSFFAEEEGFIEEAEQRGYEIQKASATEGNNFIPGIGQSRQILTFLESASEGEVSQPLELSNQFVVIRLSEIVPEGPRPFEEIESQIRTTVTINKRKEAVKQRMEGLIESNNDLKALAAADGKEINTVEALAMNATNLGDAGREPTVVGAIFNLETGEQSGIIEGNNAAFVVRVDNKNHADAVNLTDAQRLQIRRQLQQQKNAAFMEIWIDELKDEADIDDYRSQVLRG